MRLPRAGAKRFRDRACVSLLILKQHFFSSSFTGSNRAIDIPHPFGGRFGTCPMNSPAYRGASPLNKISSASLLSCFVAQQTGDISYSSTNDIDPLRGLLVRCYPIPQKVTRGHYDCKLVPDLMRGRVQEGKE